MVNYRILSTAIEFYKDKGFKYLEAPWFVSEPAAFESGSRKSG